MHALRTVAVWLLAVGPGTGLVVAAEEPPGPRAEVALREMDWDAVQAHVARQKGKVVVVNVWTTTCPTCLEDFPEFAALRQKLAGQPVEWITLNCDYDGIATKPPAYYRPRVVEFLRKHPPRGTDVLLAVPLVDFLEQAGLSSTPTVLVYDRQGKLARRFDNEQAKTDDDLFSYEDVDAEIARLLKSPQP